MAGAPRVSKWCARPRRAPAESISRGCYRSRMTARIVIALMLTLAPIAPPALAQDAPKPTRVTIEITEKGFVPESITVEKGKPIELAFTRKTDKTCATEIAIPAMKLKKALPLNEA